MQTQWNEDRARHWHLFQPPARPSAGEVTIYEREVLRIENGLPARWALFGCTPEIRSLAGRLDCEIVCIDWNRGVYEILRSLVGVHGRESLICAPWLESRIEHPVALALADGSLNMLPRVQHRAFIDRLASVLAPGGIAIIRVHTAELPRFRNPAEVFVAAREHARGEDVFTATRTDLDMLWLDRETLVADFASYDPRLRQLLAQGVITEAEYQPYGRLLPWNRIQLHYTTRSLFETMVSPRFRIERAVVGGDYTGSEHHPIYILRKK